jgi:protocatechuate 3,4-dioxygenase beta subunit
MNRLRLCACALAPVVVVLAGCGGRSNEETTRPQPAGTAGRTQPDSAAERDSGGFPQPPPCRPGAAPTPEQTEGPYYRAGPPRRRSLIGAGVTGRRLLLAGRVLTTTCRLVAGARVDFWQAGADGEYDNEGYRLRGYQLTGAGGRYRLETVVPARYGSRTPHIHVKVTPPGGGRLTTQLYLPGEAGNRSDAIFVPETLVRLRRGPGTWQAAYDFVVAPS